MKLNPSNIGIIKRLLVGRNNRPLRSILNRLEPADIASLFNTLNQREQKQLIHALITLGKSSEVLVELPETRLEDLLESLDITTFEQILEEAPIDDAAYFVGLTAEEKHESLLNLLPIKKQTKIRQYLAYPEDSAGRIMQTKVFSLPVRLNASEGLAELRSRAQEESIYYIYCVDEDERLVGVVSLRAMATAPSEKPLVELIKKDVITVSPMDDAEDVAKMVAHYDFIALPVLDKQHRLLGIVTVDDVVDIIQELATANIYAQAGLQEDDRVYIPALQSIKNRIPWMFLNLFLAGLASAVIDSYEETMKHLIVLATVKNIVPALGGNTAIQTLTVVTRGLATGDFSFISYAKAVTKEATVGLTIGVFTGLGAGTLLYLWKGDTLVSVVIFIAMVLNSFLAAIAGSIVPILLKRFNLDPATGSGVLVTMITDIFGFFAFLGIATLGLKYMS